MSLFRPNIMRPRTTSVTAEPITDDAALCGNRQVKLARAYLASLSAARRAELEREWEA